MRVVATVALLIGLGLFVWLVSEANLAAVAASVARLGALGGVAILALFAVAFAVDVAAWQLTFTRLAVTPVWTLRLWLVNMVGEAINTISPVGTLGGEPFKALLLKRHYDVSYTDGIASLLLIQTINTLAQILFVGIGVVLMFRRDILPPVVEQTIVYSTLAMAVFMGLVLAALYLRLLAHLPRKLAASRWALRFERAIAALHRLEEQLFVFVRREPLRFCGAIVFAFVNWLFGAIEFYVMLRFLGAEISFVDSWLLESVVVLVRSATFFVPGHLGVQDGAITVVGSVLTATPELGLAAAFVRRGRELVWAALGLAIGGWFGFKPELASAKDGNRNRSGAVSDRG